MGNWQYPTFAVLFATLLAPQLALAMQVATNISATGNVSAVKFIGDGSLLSNTLSASDFSNITANVGGSVAGTTNSSVTSCPTNTTLIYFGLQNDNASFTGGGWAYCRCTQSSNGIYATVINNTANPNVGCTCRGLCLSN